MEQCACVVTAVWCRTSDGHVDMTARKEGRLKSETCVHVCVCVCACVCVCVCVCVCIDT